MAYDKEVLKKAKEIGFFEDHLDPSVLSIPTKEREKLYKELKSLSPEPQKEKSIEGNIEVVKTKPLVEEKNIKLSFLEKIILFILMIFGITTESSYKRRKALDIIKNDISRMKPPLYNLRTQSVTKHFAQKIYNIYRDILPFKVLFSLTIDNEQIFKGFSVEKNLLEYIFESISDAKNSQYYQEISPEGIYKFMEKLEYKRSVCTSEIEKKVDKYIEDINVQQVAKANLVYNDFISFKKLVDFDFKSFLKMFDPNWDENTKPEFTDVSADLILPKMEDLESVLLSANVNPRIFEVVNSIIEYVKKYNVAVDEKIIEEVQKNSTTSFSENLNKKISKTYITPLIAITLNNPYYTPSFIKISYNLFEEYKKMIKNHARFIVDKIIEEKNKVLIQKIIPAMFENTNVDIKSLNISGVGVYDEQYNPDLRKYGVIEFRYAGALGVLKNVFEYLYLQKILQTLNTLIFEGNFSERSTQKLLSEYLVKLNDVVIRKLKAFEKAVSVASDFGSSFLRMIKNEKSISVEANRKLLERRIVTINSEAGEIVTVAYEIFSAILTVLANIVKDIDNQKAITVKNIFTLRGLYNKIFLSDLREVHNIVKSLVEYLKIYS